MKKILTITICGLLLGAFTLDAMAYRGPMANQCAKASCCCSPIVRGTDAHTAITHCMSEIVPSAHAKATCCHPTPIGHSAKDLVLSTARTAPTHSPHAGTETFGSQRILSGRHAVGFSHYPAHAPSLSTGIPVYLATLSIRC